MTDNLPNQALVLVAILPSPRDLEIARVLGWYRIPFRRAPKVVDVDYLAFYQTSVFGESERWQIAYTAEVRGHELTTRAEIMREEPDHPRAREEYYKVQIGPLNRLNEPIHADTWRRLTFLYTTGEYFNRARNLRDLVIQSDERELLWSSLRERSAEASKYQPDLSSQVDLDPAWLAMLGMLANPEGSGVPSDLIEEDM